MLRTASAPTTSSGLTRRRCAELSPEQRAVVLEQLAGHMPASNVKRNESEGARIGPRPAPRCASPGLMERTFGGAGAPGLEIDVPRHAGGRVVGPSIASTSSTTTPGSAERVDRVRGRRLLARTHGVTSEAISAVATLAEATSVVTISAAERAGIGVADESLVVDDFPLPGMGAMAVAAPAPGTGEGWWAGSSSAVMDEDGSFVIAYAFGPVTRVAVRRSSPALRTESTS